MGTTDFDMENCEWLPVAGYPGYEVSGYGIVRKIRRNGGSEMLVPYRDRNESTPERRKWMFFTLWRNCEFYKVPLREIMASTWGPELERRRAASGRPAVPSAGPDGGPKERRRGRPRMSQEEYAGLASGFDPAVTTAAAYMRYLRERGYRFDTNAMHRELVRIRREHQEKKPPETPKLF